MLFRTGSSSIIRPRRDKEGSGAVRGIRSAAGVPDFVNATVLGNVVTPGGRPTRMPSHRGATAPSDVLT